MADISTLYAKKLQLDSPFVVASSGLTSRAEKVKEYAEAGAGAIVLKSIFEEQMEQEIDYMSSGSEYPEAMEYLDHYVKSHALQQHIDLIKQCKDAVSVPVIASINCYKADTWLEYAHELIDAGADALELNVMRIESQINQEWGTPEEQLVKLVGMVRKQLPSVPLTLKLGKYFTNIIRLARDLKMAGADAIVLFNRTYMPDIDIDRLVITSGPQLSHPSDFSDTLRFASLVHGGVPDLSLALSTGARDGKDLIKGLLSGADVVQYCTSLYQNGAKVIGEANNLLREWMADKQYQGIGEFKGKLAATRVDHANLYQRSQFMKYYASEDANPTQYIDTSRPQNKLPY